MKVVQINAVCDYGSTGRIVSEASDFLNSENIENKLFYGNGSSQRENAVFIGNKIDHKIHALMSRILGKQGYFSKRATKKMLKQIDEFGPDLIHLHNLHGNYINLPTLFKYLSKKNIATVITLHDCFFYTGKCVHYTLTGCNRWQKECGNCPNLKSGNPTFFFDRTKKMLKDRKKWYKNIDKLGIIGVSEWITNEAKQSPILKNAKFTTVYNWIDCDVFKPHKSDVYEKLGIADKFIILGVANIWSKEKGIDDFNHLAQMIDDNYKIVLVGEIGNHYVDEKIITISRTDSVETLADLYAMADVYFNPSKEETFGKVTAEALSSGTPAIVYNKTACPELIGDGCGFVEAVGDVDSVYKDIKTLFENKDNYTLACRNFAIGKFNKIDLLNKTLDFYCELIN